MTDGTEPPVTQATNHSTWCIKNVQLQLVGKDWDQIGFVYSIHLSCVIVKSTNST